MDENVQEPVPPTPPQRENTDRSYTLLVFGPVLVGWLVSAALVPFGPLQWWINYLIVGVIWGVTKPIRIIMRAALRCAIRELQHGESSRWTCVENAYREELQEWRSKPWDHLWSVIVFTVGDALFWPIGVWVMAMAEGSVGLD